jgi:hypothetical protein
VTRVEATDVPTKNSRFGQGGYFNLQVENTPDLNSISTNDMDRQSINKENLVGGNDR